MPGVVALQGDCFYLASITTIAIYLDDHTFLGLPSTMSFIEVTNKGNICWIQF